MIRRNVKENPTRISSENIGRVIFCQSRFVFSVDKIARMPILKTFMPAFGQKISAIISRYFFDF